MKVAICIPVLLGACISGAAQTNQSKTLQEFIKENPSAFHSLTALLNNNTVQPQAKLLATNNAGKLYALPIDNMPCLVPNRHLTMEMPAVVMPPAISKIPNAVKVEPVIPADK